MIGMPAAVCARCARACSTSSEETRPACTRQLAICRLSSWRAERAARDREPRLGEPRVDIIGRDLAGDRGAHALEVEARRGLVGARRLHAARQAAEDVGLPRRVGAERELGARRRAAGGDDGARRAVAAADDDRGAAAVREVRASRRPIR